MHLPELILFDLDGTLISTEDAVTRAALAVMEAESGKRDVAALEALVGVSFKGTYEALKQQGLYHSSPETIAKAIDHHRNQIFYEEGIHFLPGVEDFLNLLKQERVPMGVVTASRKSSVDTKRKYIHLDDYFERIICAHDVRQSKPHPEPYIKAHTYFGNPANTIVFEDSPAGVQSAIAANLAVVALVSNENDYVHFEAASAILPGFTDAKNAIETMETIIKASH